MENFISHIMSSKNRYKTVRTTYTSCQSYVAEEIILELHKAKNVPLCLPETFFDTPKLVSL